MSKSLGLEDMDAPVLISGLPHFSRTKPSVRASRPPQPAYCIHTAGDCFQVFARLVYGLAREVCAIAMRMGDGILSLRLPWAEAESHCAYVTWLTLVTGGDCSFVPSGNTSP
jgi:hypothetical protein